MTNRMPAIKKNDFCTSSLSKSKTDFNIMLTTPATIAIGIHIRKRSIMKPKNSNVFSGSLVAIYIAFVAVSHLPANNVRLADVINVDNRMIRFISRD